MEDNSCCTKICIIMQTSPCNEYPLTPQFYIVKLGFTGVYLFCLIFAQNIKAVLT